MAACEPDPAARLIAYHAAIDRRDYEALGGMFAPQAVYRSNGVGSLEGRDAILAAFRAYFASHPDQRSGDDLVETIAPDAARAIWWLEATSTDTGQRVFRRGEEVIRFDGEGRILAVAVTDG